MRRIGILLADLFDEREFLYPYYRVQEAGYAPMVLGPEAREYRAKSGFAWKAEAAAGEAPPLEGLLIPGGFAPDYLRRSPEVLALVRKVAEEGKPLGAICHGPWVLVSAGLVRGRKVTGFFSIRDDLENAGGLYREEGVVVDGNLVTAQGPKDLPAFMRAFLGLFRG
ncbi:type 1 glutamine amidotransferase domain-containing protein [Thermus thermophilus]|uniref:Glutamine amidotransferase n=2 Tax=Thermus thermophilus TaxID=274 RepID=A0A7R7YJ97_THETH|nr:type 1 glutamine amidotransferase domain-containing protein [Thermus thermophilus]AAS81927.1 putative amidotransferase [Thermus thermophilus HB27]QMV31635.1 type 1 glutamine amidotransferase [Thermus thermophilus]WMV95017.1 type 1 glutamine amidotransferase domain-containing protein [Thermus thermophilus HB27]BCP67133.1 glutamine amidotransferase [Thermus thermophilus]